MALTSFQDGILFSGWDENGQELWSSDGTAEGTTLLKDLEPGAYPGSNPHEFLEFGDTLFFRATTTHEDGTFSTKLWQTDGTAEGTILASIGESPQELTIVGENLFYTDSPSDSENGLWRVDASGQRQLVKQGIEGTNLTDFDGTLYFAADDGIHGTELWQSDGTEAGTKMIVDLHEGSADSNPRSLIGIGDELYFVATDIIFARNIWKTDGTAEGTTLVWQNPSRRAELSSFIHFDEDLYFVYDHPSSVVPPMLWKSDGTPTGTVQLQANGLPIIEPRELTIREDQLIFSANDEVRGQELWATDGTEAARVAAIPQGTQGSATFRELTRVGSQIFFKKSSYVPESIWVTDGTGQGTKKISQFFIVVENLTAVDNRLFFFEDTVGDGKQLWTSDGTEAGTHFVKLFFNRMRIRQMLDVNGSLFFIYNTYQRTAANIPEDDPQLWRSDGTEAGTFAIYESTGAQLANVNGKVWFMAENDEYGAEPWVSDGTAEGTELLKDIAPGKDASSPLLLGNLDGDVVFHANDEIWISDGTNQGTRRIATNIEIEIDIHSRDLTKGVAVGERIFFPALTDQGYAIIGTDGTESGTKILQGGLTTDDHESLPHSLTVVGDTLFFLVPSGGRQSPNSIVNTLWQSDGTTAGTKALERFTPHALSESPSGLVELSGKLLLHVNGTTWQVDPKTSEQAKLVDDAGRPVRLSPGPYLTIDDELYTMASTHEFGNELFRVTLDPQFPHQTGDFNADGVTDFEDFLILSSNFGKEVVDLAMGDADEDGSVTFADFLILSSNFKTTE